MTILKPSHVSGQTFDEQDATAVTVQWNDSDTWDEKPLKFHEISAWCEQGNASIDAVVKILCARLQHVMGALEDGGARSPPFAIPFSETVLRSIFPSYSEFVAQWRDVAGGCRLTSRRYGETTPIPRHSRRVQHFLVSVTDGPGSQGFMFQTPLGHSTFCSFAIEVSSESQLRGIWLTNTEGYLPQRLLASTPILLNWNLKGTGLHLAIIPLAFPDTYSRETASELDQVLKRYQATERAVTLGYERLARSDGDIAFAALTTELHWCSTHVTMIERRWQLGALLTEALLEFLNLNDLKSWCSKSSWDEFVVCICDVRKRMTAREGELQGLPKRIKSQVTAITTLLLHRDAQLTMLITRQNIDIANSSRCTAEATRLDSQSMKTIAILTMVFLPGTFVASFFSSGLINWSPSQGQPMASAHVWIYFVITVPMTAGVLAIWWYWTRLQRRRAVEGDATTSKLAKIL